MSVSLGESIEQTVVLVEDSYWLAKSVARGLREESLAVDVCATGEIGISRVLGGAVDCVVLDLGLPDVDGITVIERIRDAGHSVPILVLTARDAVASRVDALRRGADDYVIKPFAFEELLARIRALVRRANAPRSTSFTVGNLSLDPKRLRCVVDGEPVSLTPRELRLLALFLRRRGDVLSRREILREAFDYDFDPGTNIVDVHMAHLRKKLTGASVVLESVRGVGYRLVLDA